MKKILLAVIAALLLTPFTGCERLPAGPGTTVQVDPPLPPPEPPYPKNRIAPEPRLPQRLALRGRVGLDGEGVLWDVPAPAERIGAMLCRTMHKLVVYFPDYDADVIELYALDLSSGEWSGPLVHEGCEAIVQSFDRNIAILDCVAGYVDMYTEELEPFVFYRDIDAGDGVWRVGKDLRTLFIFSFEDGIFFKDLVSGEDGPVCELPEDAAITRISNADVIFSYVNKQTLLYEMCRFDSSARELVSPLVLITAEEASFAGEALLCREGDKYTLAENGRIREFLRDGSIYLLDGGEYLVRSSDDGVNDVFTLDGAFVCSASMPEGMWAWLGDDTVYSPEYNGFFFTAGSDDGSRLMFLDLNRPGEGEELAAFEARETEPGGAVAEELYIRAGDIGEKYGLKILIADMCQTEFPFFVTEIYTDEERLSEALTILETALEKYPPNFFPQLNYGHSRYIELQFVGPLTTINNYGGDGSYAAFTEQAGGYTRIIFNTLFMSEATVFHEFSHVLDRRLEFSATNREGELFSEEDWQALQPEGFEWGYDYGGAWQYERRVNYDYFTDLYATTNSTEDRARIMEYAASGWTWTFSEHPRIWDKLDYYSRAIRAGLDTDGWPEQTVWEKSLGPYDEEFEQ